MIEPTKAVLPETEARTPDDPDAPMNPKQAVLLRDLCDKTGEEFDASLTERQADERISVLQEQIDKR
ncbi:MAG: hypothetical protein ACJASC_002596 [Limimaricola cinnabarinus]|jgi:hypothetical protein|uniref:DUF3072 domain-containing protein n=1 Tax=Limimaricola cinnabarinus LL-001 TaxID=1337093 RepID=U2YI68_9RHOB|nr:hypothetical protein [Limimaricola cinnabarinus]GAD54356.1 hypothetical protein MBELCI_0408 [Limimaricola cinnabarinus LL-001]